MTEGIGTGTPRLSGRVGRADLLVLLHHLGESDADEMAFHMGYRLEAPQKDPPTFPKPDQAPLPQPVASTEDPAEARVPLRARHFAVLARSVVAPAEQGSSSVAASQGQVLESLDGSGEPAPAFVPLSPPRRIADLLRKELRPARATGQLDVVRLMGDLVKVRVPRRLPRLSRRRWGDGAALILDASMEALPLQQELVSLIELTERLSGGETPIYQHDPGRGWLRRVRGADARWVPVAAAEVMRPSQWLLAGDLGSASPQSFSPTFWGRQIAIHTRGGGRSVALVGAAPAVWRGALPRRAGVIGWDHGQTLTPRRPVADGIGKASDAGDASLPRLLAALSLAVVIEPPLLRAIRLLLGLSMADELTAWNHPDVQRCEIGMQIRPDKLVEHRARVLAEPIRLRREVATVISRHHVGRSQLIRMEEAALAVDLAGADVADAARAWADAVATLEHGNGSDAATHLRSYLARTGRRAHESLWQSVPELADAYVIARRDELKAGAPIPAGLPATSLARYVDPHLQAVDARPTWLVQRGCALAACPERPYPEAPFLAEVSPSHGFDIEVDGQSRQWHPPVAEERRILSLDQPAGTAVVVRTEHETLYLGEVPRPSWARQWGRDRVGLYATALAPDGSPVRLYWKMPQGDQPPVFRPDGRSYLTHPLPVGSSMRIGADLEYGLWCEFDIRRVTQRLRWIEPGTFLMGSPADEPERSANEGPQHEVRISEGFWLADTACTQGLWEAVTGRKPSYFKGDASLPVEQVNWNYVQRFLAQLESALPGIKATLPSEAEWEYACRAGTGTPFSFGQQITPEQVNYNGNFPYNDGAEGEYRKRTVPVKSLPANAWGLYEMHGNVFEWCADGQREYDGQPQRDPFGPEGPETYRALRGGLWSFSGGAVRSASRGDFKPGRDGFIGFRLSLRSIQPGPVVHGGPGLLRPQGDPEDAAPGRSGTRRSGAPPGSDGAGWLDKVTGWFRPGKPK